MKITNKFNKYFVAAAVGLSLTATVANADQYKIDLSHSFIEFSTLHLGYSALNGRFNDFGGSFEYSADGSGDMNVNVDIKTDSLDTNWAARDKHLRGADFFDVAKFPTAKFMSTSVSKDGEKISIKGDLTLHGVTKAVELTGKLIGEGKDPWGGYRAGFTATTTINRQDYGVKMNLGPKSDMIDITLSVEGIKK